MNLTTLAILRVDDLINAIGLPEEKLCTFCWTGKDHTERGNHRPSHCNDMEDNEQK